MNLAEQVGKDYYKIPMTLTSFWCWLIISIFLNIITLGLFIIILLVPVFLYWHIKNINYSYNNEKIILKKGILNKRQDVLPLYKIDEINSSSFLGIGDIFIVIKGKKYQLSNIKNANDEVIALIENWEKAKQENIRTEVF